MSTPSVVERLPSVHDYQRLRRAVGWSEIDDDAASGASRAPSRRSASSTATR
ncbi:MAG: hypothetical protein ACXVQ0_05175 [Actinomycetota bacterium]